MPETPKNMWVELTNSCNHKCSMCFHGNDTMSRPKGVMDFEVFKKIIDEVAEYKPEIYLHHSGESFLHKQVFECIKYAKEKGVKVGMTTNGTLLDKDNFALLDSGADNINISLSGVDEEDYTLMHKVDQFKEVMDKVTRFAEEKTKRGVKTQLTLNVILTKNNKKRVKAFKKEMEAKEGIDGVIVRRLMSWTDNVEIGHLAPSPYRIHFVKPFRMVRKLFVKDVCDLPKNGVGILWDGAVVPCCIDFNGSLSLGNIKENTFQEIWNGERMNKLRSDLTSLKKTKAHPLCGPCMFPEVKK